MARFNKIVNYNVRPYFAENILKWLILMLITNNATLDWKNVDVINVIGQDLMENIKIMNVFGKKTNY